MKKYNVVFFGTPQFAVPSLQKLINNDLFNVSAVVTQPDKPFGRKQILTKPPIKILAEQNHINVYQPSSLEDLKIDLSNFDIAVVVAYAKLMPDKWLSLPKMGFVNIHGSLLPKQRGAACIQGAILSGTDETGTTLIRLNKNLDSGDVVGFKKIKIYQEDTYQSLYNKLSMLGAELLEEKLPSYLENKIPLIKQDNSSASYVGKVSRESGRIDWLKDAEYIDRLVRAMYPHPSAWTTWQGKNLKIHEANPLLKNFFGKKPGEIVFFENKIVVVCQKNALVVNELQLEGKKRAYSKDFINGNSNFVGSILK